MTTAARKKAARLRAEDAVQIIARSDRGVLAIISGKGGLYQTTALNTPVGWIAGTCTCPHGRKVEDPIYNTARGEGCYHFLALVEEAQADA